MNLLAVRALVDVPVDYVLVDYKHCLSGTTIARQRVMRFNLDDPDDPSAAERSEIPLSLVAHTMISIPLVSPWNPRHVRYVVNLFFTDEAEVTISDNDLARYGECAAIAMESSMSDLCSSTSAEVNLVASRSKRVKDFLEAMVAIVKDSLECEGVAIFTVNNTGKKLELKATTGTHWTVPTGEQFYLKGEGLTGGVWASGKTLITPNAHCEKGWLGKSLEGDESRSRDAHLGVPLTKPNGETIGVIRVRNRVYHRTLGTTVFCSFADDDAEVLENIAQAAIPHLELLLSQDRRVKAVGKLTHELKVPIVAIRGAVDLMKSSKGIRAILTHDYLGDILSWTDLMMGLLNNLDLIQYSSLRIPIHPRKTRFLADVVAPAVRQMKPVLRAKGLDPARITRRGTAQVPPMWIDPSRFQQVIFNLISNAVKYSYDDPDAFRVDIYGFSDNRGIIIRCDDYGIGINPGEEAMIFEEGYRGTGAIEKDVTGHGLGLWVVRRIVEMHDGQIEVTNNRYPTQFTISLPTYLTHRPASPQDKELL
jgi:signal transduction histidine kinase